jgi:hypothetical protein
MAFSRGVLFAAADALRTMRGVAAHCIEGCRRYRGSVPEVDSLGSDRAVPKLLEARSLRACGCVLIPAGICALEERSERAEDAGARAERHDRCLCPLLSRLAIRVEE